MSYTPGPWKITVSYRPDQRSDYHIFAKNSSEVAIVRDGRHPLDTAPNGEAEANARLIAAAPETFAALKELRHTLRGFEHLLAGSEVARLAAVKKLIDTVDGVSF